MKIYCAKNRLINADYFVGKDVWVTGFMYDTSDSYVKLKEYYIRILKKNGNFYTYNAIERDVYDNPEYYDFTLLDLHRAINTNYTGDPIYIYNKPDVYSTEELIELFEERCQ